MSALGGNIKTMSAKLKSVDFGTLPLVSGARKNAAVLSPSHLDKSLCNDPELLARGSYLCYKDGIVCIRTPTEIKNANSHKARCEGSRT